MAFDAFSAGGSGASPKTVAHTVSTPGAYTGIYAIILSDAGDTVTGATYDGNTMTQRQKNVGIYVYEWIGTSSSGSKNVTVSASSGTLYVSVISFTSVDAFDAGGNNSDFGTTPLNFPVTTIADDCWAVAAYYDGGQSSTPTAGSGTTKAGANGDYSGVATFYSTTSLGAAGAKNLQANVAIGGTNQWAIVSFSHASDGAGSGSDTGIVQMIESSTNLIRVTVPEETP